VLVVLVDLSPLAEHPPADQERILLRELGDYEPELLDRPRLVVGSRADLAEPDVAFEGPRIAAVTGEGIPKLLGLMAEQVRAARELEPEPEAFVIHRPAPEGFRIERDEYGDWHVIGRQATRAVALSDLTQVEAMDEAQRRLKAMGIDKALARAGAQPGDTVHIGKLSFDYQDE
jgi:GTP-binding protein